MKKEDILSIILTVLSLLAVFAAGYFTNQLINPPELDLPILSQAREIMENHSLAEPPSIKEQEYGMIHGLVSSYDDPYASFVEPVQHELYSNTFEGSFGGIGAQITINTNGETILYPFPDSPAKKAGIMDDDVLVAVGGIEITTETPLDTTVSFLRGPVGSLVNVVIYRPVEGKNYEFEIKRKEFLIPSVSWRILQEYPNVGLIRINLISKTTPEEILEAATDLQSAGAKSFILDLRQNAGGLLEAGIDVARLFLEEGVIIHEQYSRSDPDTYIVEEPGELSQVDLAVLIDSNTASAAEIIAGALQYHKRAVLVGLPSYGKNTIQLVFTLEDQSSIHVTNGKWWLPGEQETPDFHILPEIQISPENYSDAEFFRLAVDYLTAPE